MYYMLSKYFVSILPNSEHCRLHINPCPGSSFFATFAGSWGYFTPDISRVLEQIATKFQRLSAFFLGQTS